METTITLAESLAADLAGAQVDPNEAQKALAYLRSKGQSQALFDYLQIIVGTNGGAVIRSGRTLSYYRDLLQACQRHLAPLKGNYPELLATFAWSLRLLRYYRAVPEAARERAAQARQAAPEPQRPAATSSSMAARPSASPIPQQGEVFRGTVLEVSNTAVLIEVPGFAPEKVAGVIKADQLGSRRYRPGNAARVEVLGLRQLKSGLLLIELKPAPRAEAPAP